MVGHQVDVFGDKHPEACPCSQSVAHESRACVIFHIVASVPALELSVICPSGSKHERHDTEKRLLRLRARSRCAPDVCAM